MNIVTETSPHIRKKSSVNKMMGNVLIALLPTVIFSFVIFQLDALKNFGISLGVILLAEFVFTGLKNMMPKDGKKHTFKEKFLYAYKGKIHLSSFLSGTVTATIFALILPASAQWYAVLSGALIGEIFGKLFFGGLGNNIFNPACVGMIFSKVCFGSQYTYTPNWYINNEFVASGTPLYYLKGDFIFDTSHYSILELFLGKVPGTIGEVFKVTILLGLIWLLITKAADFRIILSSTLTFSLLMAIVGATSKFVDNVGYFVLYQLLSGGFLFGVTFMLTDPVTSPINRPSRILYGIIFAILTTIIRLYGATPEGVGFAILLSNIFVPLIEYPKWSSNKYTVKKILWMIGLIVLCSGLIILISSLNNQARWSI
mgnify:CR=1 FL=1